MKKIKQHLCFKVLLSFLFLVQCAYSQPDSSNSGASLAPAAEANVSSAPVSSSTSNKEVKSKSSRKKNKLKADKEKIKSAERESEYNEPQEVSENAGTDSDNVSANNEALDEEYTESKFSRPEEQPNNNGEEMDANQALAADGGNPTEEGNQAVATDTQQLTSPSNQENDLGKANMGKMNAALTKKDTTRESLWNIAAIAFNKTKTVFTEKYKSFEQKIRNNFLGWKIRFMLYLLLYLLAYIYSKQTQRDVNVSNLLTQKESSTQLGLLMNGIIILFVSLVRPFWFLFDFVSQYVFPYLSNAYKFFNATVYRSGFLLVAKLIYHAVFRLFFGVTKILLETLPRIFRADFLIISFLTLSLVYISYHVPMRFLNSQASDIQLYTTVFFHTLSYFILALGVGLLQLRYAESGEQKASTAIVWLGSKVIQLLLPAVLIIALQAGLLWGVVFSSVKWILTPTMLILGYGMSVWAILNYFLLLVLLPALVGYYQGAQRLSVKALVYYSLSRLPQYIIIIPIGILLFSFISIIPNTIAFSSSHLSLHLLNKLDEKQKRDYTESLKKLAHADVTTHWYSLKQVSDDSLTKCFDNYNKRFKLDYEDYEFKRIYNNSKTALSQVPSDNLFSTFDLYNSLSEDLKGSGKKQDNIKLSGNDFSYQNITKDTTTSRDKVLNCSKQLHVLDLRIDSVGKKIAGKQEELNAVCEEQEDTSPKKKKEDEPLFKRDELDKCDLQREKISKEILGLQENKKNLLKERDQELRQQKRVEAIAKFLTGTHASVKSSMALTKSSERSLLIGLSILLALIYALANIFFLAGFAAAFAAINRFNWQPWQSKFGDYFSQAKALDNRNPLMGIIMSFVVLYFASMAFDFNAGNLCIRVIKALYHDMQSVYDQCVVIIDALKDGLKEIIRS